MKLMIKKYCGTLLLFTALILAACSAPSVGAFLSVNAKQCIGCGECTDVCETKAIRMVNGKAVIDPASCVECGKCVVVCPKDAIY